MMELNLRSVFVRPESGRDSEGATLFWQQASRGPLLSFLHVRSDYCRGRAPRQAVLTVGPPMPRNQRVRSLSDVTLCYSLEVWLIQTGGCAWHPGACARCHVSSQALIIAQGGGAVAGVRLLLQGWMTNRRDTDRGALLLVIGRARVK